MINVDLRRYGTDKEYRQFINGYISGADIDETPVEYQLVRSVKEEQVSEEERRKIQAEKYIQARLEFIRRNSIYGINFEKDYERPEQKFHCGFEESGGHAYNCNDCPNKCDEWHQWDKEFKEKGDKDG